jgi:hypothetical protein
LFDSFSLPYLVGWWVCKFCPWNDDATGITEHAASAWGSDLTTMLVQSGSATLKNAESCSVTMKNKDAKNEEDSPRVAIEFGCSGLQTDKLSATETAVLGEVLQASYNAVEESELSNVVVTGQGALGWWICKFCPWNDDLLGASVSGAASKAWAAKFANGLVATRLAGFKNVDTCDIKMSPHQDEAEPNVSLSVKCEGGANFNSLSAHQSSVVAQAIQTAFNNVHSNGHSLSKVQSSDNSSSYRKSPITVHNSWILRLTLFFLHCFYSWLVGL